MIRAVEAGRRRISRGSFGASRRAGGIALAVGVLLASVLAAGAGAAPGDVAVSQVANIDPSPTDGSSIESLTNVGGTLFFGADDDLNGSELWKSDGTAAGTAMVANIRTGNPPGSSPGDSANPEDLIDMGGTLLFEATDGINGDELWKSNGGPLGPGGTEMVENINTGDPPGSDPDLSSLVAVPTNVNGTLLFEADDGISGQELWKSAPPFTAATTSLVEDIQPGPGSGGVVQPANVGGTAIFASDDDSTGLEPWRSESPYDSDSTELIEDLNGTSVGSFPAGFTKVNGTVFFSASTGSTVLSDNELWKVGSPYTGASRVEDINRGNPAGSDLEASSDPGAFVNVNGTLFFAADDGINGKELWKSEPPGYDAASTSRVADINPGPGGSNPDGLVNFNGSVYFSADDGANGTELWKSNGTGATLMDLNTAAPGADSSPGDLTVSGGRLFFSAEDASGEELWVSDGITQARVSDIAPGAGGAGVDDLTDLNGTLFFSAREVGSNNELWKAVIEGQPAIGPTPTPGPPPKAKKCKRKKKKGEAAKRCKRRRRRGASRAPARLGPAEPLLDSLERLPHEPAQRPEVIAALLHDHRRQPEQTQLPPRRPVALGRHPERALRVCGCRVHPQRHHQPPHIALARPRRQRRNRRQPLVVARSGRQRQVAVGAGPVARALLAPEPEEVREPPGPGIHVDRSDEHPRVLVEDRLRAVAVMRIDVDHRHRAVQPRPQPRRRSRRVVQVAGAAEARPRRVVPGRAAARVGSGLPAQHELGGGERGVDRGPGRLPGPGADQRHRVVGEVAGARGGRGRRSRRLRGHHPGVGKHVGHDPVLARVRRKARAPPLLPRRLQVGEQIGVVDLEQRLIGVGRGRHEPGAHPFQRLADRVRARRELGPGRPHAHPDLASRIVQPVAVAPGHGHREAHAREPIRWPRARPALLHLVLPRLHF